jgi:thymidine phosphorylase
LEIQLLPQEIIRRKRDGGTLSASEIGFLVEGLVDGRVGDGQAAAFAMAVFFRGMNNDECVALTEAMMRSGTVLDWRGLGLPGPVLDKHSTGGIGDNVSLVLAPAVAACGGFVPMISGRGLGHTGGTLDKLDAIPGYVAQPDNALFRKVVRDVGCAIIGQTQDLAPADKRLYAIRDVTATVESIPLITASILSKKLAAGLQGLVMDVKTGSGAFMVTFEGAQDLARSLVAVANQANLPTTALITDMNQPLASAAGNALEVQNAVELLTGTSSDTNLREIVVALGAEMLQLGGLAENEASGRAKIEEALASGAAAERFDRMVAALGGPAGFIEKCAECLPQAPVRREVWPEQPGIVETIDARAIGLAVVALGGGRTRAEDTIDPAVGFAHLARLQDEIGTGGSARPLGVVHARSAADADEAAALLREAYHLGGARPSLPPLIHARIGQGGRS